ncbi:exonuclease domain-containing protein [Brevibacillus dissolubilis]|uniref:exonuclease domain-containing protein n=1 Tax=Brevibacillus dissolubilis TaxID=1844116 RepID=UPI0011169094|nr:exonuclease domain-containing protein [Brevibacillus dissolubilis]
MRQNWNPLNRLWNLYRESGLPSSLSSGVSGNAPSDQAFLRAMKKEAEKKSSIDMPLETLEVVVVDLETTGFHPHHGDEIISIGAVAMRGSEVLASESFFSLIQPKRAIPPHIQTLTGLTPEALADAPELLAVLSQFFQYVRNRPLVAHHSRHEREFLQAGLWKTSRTKFAHRLMDTMLLVRLCDGLQRDGSLDALCERNGITIEKRHDALHDATATAKLWGIYLEKAVSLGYRDLHDVYQQVGNMNY